jgi:hypothetical protein
MFILQAVAPAQVLAPVEQAAQVAARTEAQA